MSKPPISGDNIGIRVAANMIVVTTLLGIALLIAGVLANRLPAPIPKASDGIPANLPHLGATIDQLTQMLGRPQHVGQKSTIMPFGNRITWLKQPDPAWSIVATCIEGRCLRITYQHAEGRITDDQKQFLTARNGLEHLTWIPEKPNATRWTAYNGTTLNLNQHDCTLEITLPAFGEAVEALKAAQAARSSQIPKF